MIQRSLLIMIHFSFIMLLGCEFKFSPYTADTIDLEQNTFNLKVIMEQEPQVDANFKIAFIADTHNYYEDLDDQIKVINANGPYSFVIVAGDITNDGLLEEYDETRNFLNDLHYPYLVAVGNHDLLSNGDKIYEKMFGETDFSFVYKNLHLIFFNNNNWEAPGAIPNKNWVENRLSTSTTPFKILIAHISPLDTARFTTESMREWEDLMTTYNVNYFFHGHNHNPGEDPLGTAQKINIGSPSKRVYYELIVTPGGLTHQKISF